ncbi:MAG: hypothetical protein OEL54_01645 [Flavobacteriaceae bacterium]|nr:hypothetical protein [Flavobacteriaceae bacterium]
MEQEKKDQLRKWFENLEQSQQIDIAIECIEELILTELINYYESSNAPYWDATGDRLDGSEPEDED